MHRYTYRDQLLTIKELSEMSGVQAHTLRDRLRRGFTVEQAVKPLPIHESVEQFCEHSWYPDWIGTSIDSLYGIYWKWCSANGYTATSKQGFSRQINTIYPQLKTVPTANANGSQRIIREKS